MGLPLEILNKIFSYMSPKDAIKTYLSTGSLFYSLNPAGENGRYIWKKYREQLGFPDPRAINLTDFLLLKIYYTLGCDHCKKHPRTRKIYWEFHGKRMCNSCLSSVTIRDYLIKDDNFLDEMVELPCIEKSGFSEVYGYAFYRIYSYKMIRIRKRIHSSARKIENC